MIDNYGLFNLNSIDIPESEKDLITSAYISSENILIIRVFDDINALENSWDKVQHFVAGNVQSNLEVLGLSEQLAWNIYIIFLINFPVPSKLKTEIESNKFCCKKYIVYVDDTANESHIEQALKEQIPLLAEFEIGGGRMTISSDDSIKQKIYEFSNQNTLAQKFVQTPEIQELIRNENIETYINELLEEY